MNIEEVKQMSPKALRDYVFEQIWGDALEKEGFLQDARDKHSTAIYRLYGYCVRFNRTSS